MGLKRTWTARETLERFANGIPGRVAYHDLSLEQAAARVMLERIDAALALHKRTSAGNDWGGYCPECSDEGAVEWPCATFKALRGKK